MNPPAMRLIVTRFIGLMPVCFTAMVAAKPQQIAEDSINKIMVAAHVRDVDGKGNRGTGRNLDTRVTSGKATDREKARLLELYEKLEKLTPPRGDLVAWKRQTGEMTTVVKAVIAKEKGAEERLAKLINCKACHDQFRGNGRQNPGSPAAPPSIPSGPTTFSTLGDAPKLAETAGLQDGHILIKEVVRKTQFVPEFVPKEVSEEVEGKVRKKIVNEIVHKPVQVAQEKIVKVPINQVKVYDQNGQILAPSEVAKRLSEPTFILYSEVGVSVNPAFLKAARPGTCFVVLPASDPSKSNLPVGQTSQAK